MASVAMHLVQKGQPLANIKEELVRLKKGSEWDGHATGDYKTQIHILGGEVRMDKDWKNF